MKLSGVGGRRHRVRRCRRGVGGTGISGTVDSRRRRPGVRRRGPVVGAIGTDWLRSCLALPNYPNSLLRSGFSSDDLSSVSDRLLDAIIAWGDEGAIMRRVDQHRAAGADHACIQVLTSEQRKFPREQGRRIAAAMPDPGRQPDG